MIGVGIREIHHELVERVESGTGSDRELDCLIAQAVLGATHDGQPEPYRKWTLTARDGARVTGSDAVMIRPFTDSLDAVVLLIEQKLPEITDNSAADFLAASIDEMMVRGWRPGEPNIPQICRAVLAAFLRALQEARTLADAHSKNPPEAEHG